MQWLGHEARSGYMLKRPPQISFFKGGRHVEPFVNGLWSYQNPFYPFTTLTLMLVVVCSWMEMMDHSISLLRRSALAFVKICIFSIRVKFLHKVESLCFLKVESILHFRNHARKILCGRPWPAAALHSGVHIDTQAC
ncbi:hypothetical protein V1478_018463 [Vespula squamosa]|uniref:Uncharacterized protein n=1 Tax=Vespula squamosa TaxID=30214 RepID=A0ABD1ZV31_VESSQ